MTKSVNSAYCSLENSCQDTKLAPHVRHKAGNRAKLHLKSIHILGLTGFVFPELHNFIRHRTVIPGKLLRGCCHLTAGVQQHMADRWASCVQYSLAAAVKAACLAVDRAVMKSKMAAHANHARQSFAHASRQSCRLAEVIATSYL